MKAAKIYDMDDIRIEDLPIPEIGPRDALVKMYRCGICSGDVTPWYIRRKAPIVVGHEPAGVVEALGDEVGSLSIGDRVFIHHHAPCYRCRHCRRGNFTLCATWKKTHLDPGGIAEYVRVPEINLRYDTLILPDSVSLDDGTLIEPVACSVKAIEKVNIRPGDVVLIIGLGFMGQLNGMVARHYGAKTIIGADMVPYRLDKALELGMDHVVHVEQEDLTKVVEKLTDGFKADVVIVGPGSVPAMNSGLTCAGKGGTVLFFMSSPEDAVLSFKPFDIYFDEITIVCSYSCGPNDTRMALDLITSGVITADQVVTHRFPIEETEKGIQVTATARDSLKTLITIHD
ncbi:MAG: alcohol dehydrogenase catalytic domain-containing protein [Gemmatimonadota bacterium]|nr:alcohol dehydrogenase catalytic domain-containing protein [Gemmatimonadota bacterium]